MSNTTFDPLVTLPMCLGSEILTQWLTLHDITRLDTAYCNTSNKKSITATPCCVRVSPPGGGFTSRRFAASSSCHVLWSGSAQPLIWGGAAGDVEHRTKRRWQDVPTQAVRRTARRCNAASGVLFGVFRELPLEEAYLGRFLDVVHQYNKE